MPHEEIREENIRHSIEVGIRVLICDGVPGIQKQKISEEAGVSTRSLIRYFGNRENYITAILMQMSQNDYDAAKAYWNEQHMDEKMGIEQMKILFDSLQKIYNRQSARILAIVDAQMFLQKSDSKNKTGAKMREAFNMFSQIIEQCMVNGQKDGSIRQTVVDVNMASDTIASSIFGTMHQLAFMDCMEFRSKEEIQIMLKEYFDRTLEELAV